MRAGMAAADTVEPVSLELERQRSSQTVSSHTGEHSQKREEERKAGRRLQIFGFMCLVQRKFLGTSHTFELWKSYHLQRECIISQSLTNFVWTLLV